MKTDRTSKWRAGLAVSAIVIAALVVRLAYSLAAGGVVKGVDPDAYLSIARNLADGQGFASVAGQPTAYRPPLYPVFVAAVLMMSGGSLKVVAVVQAVISALTIAGVYGIARKLGGKWAGLAAAVILAIDPFMIHTAGEGMSEALFCLFLVGGIFYLVMSEEGAKGDGLKRGQAPFSRTVLAALCIALAGMTRPIAWPLAAVPIVLAIGRGGKLSARLAHALLVVAICAAVSAPWIVRNKMRFGAFIPTTTHGGYTLYLGNNPYLRDAVRWHRGAWLSGESTFDAFEQEVGRARRERTEMEFDRFMRRKGMEYIRGHPKEALLLAAAKFTFFWRPAPSRRSSRGDVPDVVRYALGTFSVLLFAGAAAGLVMIRKKRGLVLVMLFPVVLMTVTHTILWSQLRFRLPLHPLLAALCGVAAGAVIARRGGKDLNTCAE